MVIVSAEYGHMLKAQNLGDSSTQRCFASSAVSYYPQDDGTRRHSKWYNHVVLSTSRGARFQGGGKPRPYPIRSDVGQGRPNDHRGSPWEITCYNDTWHEI